MSRLSQAPGRNLSLTEELERLEQSITLTLQEIDHNFSKAHRIVTSSILPVVEQYAKHSQDAWEGTKVMESQNSLVAATNAMNQFWKQFFEASANVSLSGYEETPQKEDVTQTETAISQDTTFQTPTEHDEEEDNTITGVEYEDEEDETSIIDSPSNATGVHSTPRLPHSTAKGKNRRVASPSPSPPKSSAFTSPPRPRAPLSPEEVSTPIRGTLNLNSSSPFEPPSAFQPATAQRQNPDPIMHRVLDRNFRIQATPLTSKKQYGRPAAPSETPATTQRTQTRTLFPDSSPMSSPEMAAPQLRSDLFSPEKTRTRTTPRTPGISVQTPGRDVATSTGRALFSTTRDTTTGTLWASDSDSDEDGAISPPKTMQFHIPQSRLLQTPAREASKKIVDDLLATAGADMTDEIEEEDVPEISPSIVRRKWEEDDDTFSF